MIISLYRSLKLTTIYHPTRWRRIVTQKILRKKVHKLSNSSIPSTLTPWLLASQLSEDTCQIQNMSLWCEVQDHESVLDRVLPFIARAQRSCIPHYSLSLFFSNVSLHKWRNLQKQSTLSRHLDGLQETHLGLFSFQILQKVFNVFFWFHMYLDCLCIVAEIPR